MSKIILFLVLFLLQGCTKELTNVGYNNFNFDSSKIKDKTPVNVEKNVYCLLVFCNRYDYGLFDLNADEFIYDVINDNKDKGNAITDIDINWDRYDFIFFYRNKITLTGNMFEDTSSQP